MATLHTPLGTDLTRIVAAVLVACLLGANARHADAADVEPVSTTQIPELDSNIACGRAEVVLKRPIEEVHSLVVDYAAYVQFMPHFTKSKVLAQRGSRARVYIEVSVAKGVITLWGQLDMKEKRGESDERLVQATLLDGNVNAFRAEWRLTPTDDGARTRVEFRIYVDPDLPLPSAVFSRENERAAGRAVEALRLRALGEAT